MPGQRRKILRDFRRVGGEGCVASGPIEWQFLRRVRHASCQISARRPFRNCGKIIIVVWCQSKSKLPELHGYVSETFKTAANGGCYPSLFYVRPATSKASARIRGARRGVAG